MVWENYNAALLIFGGLAFFMYGMSMVSDYLQKLAANRIRELFQHISGKKYLAILIGILMTILLQSSGAVTSMLVGLGSAEVVTLRQVMGLLVGTAVGSTFTVQIISFNIVQYGMPMFIVGFFFFFITKKRIPKNIAGVFLGFGMLFIGLEMMGQGTTILKKYDFVIQMFKHLNTNPLLSVIVTALFTALVHSSAVTIGLAMTLATSGIIDFHHALYWIYGANIGTTGTALMASLGSNYVGRQVAWAHFFYKTGSFFLFYFLTDLILMDVLPITNSVTRDIANAHTILNIASAIIFYPLIDVGATWIEKIFTKSDSEKQFGPEYLNKDTYQNAALAYAQARREALRMGDILISMLKDSIDLFKVEDPELVESIQERDTQVDILQKEIKLFLAKMTAPGAQMGEAAVSLITYVSDLESAGDVIDNGILELARKKHALKLEFSHDGWKELQRMHAMVLEIATLSLTCFHLQDKDLAEKVIMKKRALRQLEKELKESHIDRLKKGLQETINTSSIHMDLLSDFRRITGLLANHAYSLCDLGRK